MTERQKSGQATRAATLRKRALDKYLTTPFDSLGMENKRRRVFEEQNYCCNRCGISEWQGQPIRLEYEHKDGDSANNVRENVEGLCPNCHSLTDTYKGKNKRTNQKKYSDAEYYEAYTSQKSIRQALLSLGLAGKGSNYNRMRRVIRLYEGTERLLSE